MKDEKPVEANLVEDKEKKIYHTRLNRIGELHTPARTQVVRKINKAQVLAYWHIGRKIVVFGQKGKSRGEYGERLIENLSQDMSQKFKPRLSWSHYYELLKIDEPLARLSMRKWRPMKREAGRVE